MNRNTLIISLAVCIALTALAAAFASSSPDGLEWIAEQLGFAGNAHSAVPKISSPFWIMFVAGPVGVIVTFIVAVAVSEGIKKLKKKKEDVYEN